MEVPIAASYPAEPALPAAALAQLSLDRHVPEPQQYQEQYNQQQEQYLPYSHVVAAPAPAPAALPAAASGWYECWSTDPADHDHMPVTGIVYSQSLPGLPGGEGHAGWAISGSKGLLQLWECSRSGGRGEPALMMMHSQATEHSMESLVVDLDTKMLLAACADFRGGEWAAFHSLDPDTLLAQRGRVPMPHRPESRLPGRNCNCVVSLNNFGGPLTAHCAASYGGGVAIWGTAAAQNPASPQAPRAVWKAHDALITAIHAGDFGLNLYSGAADGSVHLWHMKAKPSAPSAIFHQSGRIAGIFQVNDQEVVTAAADGALMVWDIRNPGEPLKFATMPDGSPISHLAVSPVGDAAAVATPTGIYCVDLLDPGCHVGPVSVVGGLRAAVSALTWNAATGEIIVGGADGCVRVWRRNHM